MIIFSVDALGPSNTQYSALSAQLFLFLIKHTTRDLHIVVGMLCLGPGTFLGFVENFGARIGAPTIVCLSSYVMGESRTFRELWKSAERNGTGHCNSSVVQVTPIYEK
jgi:hypothetical protein